MNSEEVDAAVAEWITPATMNLSDETLVARKAAVRSLASSAPLAALVGVAHANSDTAAVDLIEVALKNSDTSYVVGKSELAARIAGSALMTVMTESSDRATRAALLIQSARFLGWVPTLPVLHGRADEVEFRRSIAVRQRQLPKKPSPASKLKPDEGTDASNADIVAAINANARRFDDLYEVVEQRFVLVDEEVNLLWWARSDVGPSGMRWDKLDGIERAVEAAAVLSNLLTSLPALPAATQLLPEVAGSSKKSTTILDFVGASTGSAIRDNTAAEPLLPLLSAAAIARQYSDEPAALPGVLRKASIDPSFEFRVDSIAMQVLRELSIQKLRP